jgi:very-long-chain (3R)-3-hydroxyacyl-CoA dehydratase
MNKRNWLILFNGVTLVAWLVFLAVAAKEDFRLGMGAAIALAVAQGLAVFEVMNTVLRIAGSNFLLTGMQVASRLLVMSLLVMMASDCPCDGSEKYGYPLILLAWTLTEVVRALNYLSDLLNLGLKMVAWLRYSMFIVLYPLGVTGEFLIMYGFWKWRGEQIDLIALTLAGIALSYVIFFPKLYGHMLAQRKKKLG